jgi:primary-amine oxidase
MTATEDTPATTGPEDTGASPRHPLDPLTGAEIEAATSILKRDRNLADSARFVYVTLRELAKETVLSHQPGQTPDREAHIVLRERKEHARSKA